MARKALIEKNKRKRELVQRYAKKRAALVEVVKDANASYEQKREAIAQLSKLPRSSSATRFNKICSISGRSRGYIGFFDVSRLVFRELALKGLLPGVKKTSW